MERNHMAAPTRDREAISSHARDALGPPPALPPLSLLGHSPPAYSAMKFPEVPNTALPLPLPPLSRVADHDVKLPSLSSLPLTSDMAMTSSTTHWPPPQPLTALPIYHGPLSMPHHAHSRDSPARMDLDTSSNSVGSAASPDRFQDARATSVTLDDPDVRLAAEALGDLRADFVSSPPNHNSSLPVSPPTTHTYQSSTSPHSPLSQSLHPEPLLSLLTTSHPLLASTIEGATSAYGGAKNFSPRFRSGAEYVEGYLTPIAKSVGSVGRVTGVEGGVRWFLERRQSGNGSDIETGKGSKKRRKAENEAERGSNKRLEMEGMKQIGGLAQLPAEMGTQQQQQDVTSPSSKTASRRMSMASTTDTLPAYDDVRSPAYTETAATDAQSSPQPTSSESNQGAWQSRLIMSTSGLSIAMSDESLRSLKYCLRWLKWANEHIARVIAALKNTLEQFDRQTGYSQPIQLPEKGQPVADGNAVTMGNGEQQSQSELIARITSLKGDVLKTLQSVIVTVSKYAGGALPENARILVRRHLTSLPQRFRLATMSENGGQDGDKHSESAVREGAHKVLVLAQEGLDMVVQVSGVLDGTIVSAEEWCDRMGKRRRRNPDEDAPVLPQTEPSGDVKMG